MKSYELDEYIRYRDKCSLIRIKIENTWLAQAPMPGRWRARYRSLHVGLARMPGRVRRNFRQWSPAGPLDFLFCWEESRPWRGLRCRAGGAAGVQGRLLCRAGMSKPRWASHQTRLGEPTHWASQYSLGEPVLNHFHSGLHACFKAAPAWRCAYGARSALPARHVRCPRHWHSYGARSAP